MTQTVRLIHSDTTLTIAPGQEVVDIPREAVPRYGFVQLVALPDGTYRPVLKSWNAMVKLTFDLPKQLALDVAHDTLSRLVRAEFISGRYISPSNCLIDLNSLYEHLEACRDPEFWNPQRRARYQQAIRG